MAEKRHGQSKERYSVILLDILPNSIQIAISKDFAEDLTPKTSVLTGYTTRSKIAKNYTIVDSFYVISNV